MTRMGVTASGGTERGSLLFCKGGDCFVVPPRNDIMIYFNQLLFLISPGFFVPGAKLFEQMDLLADVLQRDPLRFHHDANAVEAFIEDRTC
jgi:hypothetical protein